MFNIEKAHFIIDEMVMSGYIVDTNKTNILNPQNITVTRGLNNRRFFNQVQYQYDQADDGTYYSIYRAIDTTSLNNIGTQSILPVDSQGVQTNINGVATGTPALIQTIANTFLTRFSEVALEIKLTTNMVVGAQIEAGDIVKLVDDGSLGITNFQTGTRNLGTNLYEVIDRNLDLKSGVCRSEEHTSELQSH